LNIPTDILATATSASYQQLLYRMLETRIGNVEQLEHSIHVNVSQARNWLKIVIVLSFLAHFEPPSMLTFQAARSH
jgi:transcriptional regulator